MKLPEISVHPFAPAGIFLVLFALPPPYAFAVVVSTLLHELGHACAAAMLGKKIRKITVMPVGINIRMTPASSYIQEIVIALAGPLQNLALIACAPLFSGCEKELCLFSSLAFAVNVAPMATLDGGRILCALVSRFTGAETGEKVVRISTCACLFLMWILSVYIFFYTAENAALLIFCSYIFAAYIISRDN